jgi:hypothetical protein
MDQYDCDEKVEKFETDARATLMKLFMAACKNGREQRAYEIASIMEAQPLQLAIKYATKTRALNLAQNLNMLAERKAELEYAQASKERSHMDEYGDSSKNYSCFNNTTGNNNTTTGVMIEDTQNDVVIEKTTQASHKPPASIFASSNNTPKLNDTTNSQIPSTNASEYADSTNKTPVLTPLMATSRLNPFAKNTPSNGTPNSIMSKIAENLSAKHTQSASKADSWKPVSTKKSALKPK